MFFMQILVFEVWLTAIFPPIVMLDLVFTLCKCWFWSLFYTCILTVSLFEVVHVARDGSV